MKLIHVFKSHKFSSLFLVGCFIFIIMLGSTTVYAQKDKPFVVVLDAGHGGKDPGKIGYKGAKEKDVALKIVLGIGKKLAKIPEIKVIYTRKTDVFVDLWKRGDIANDADADLFVSVHCNAHTSQAIGSETWVLGVHANEKNFRVAKAENEVILQEENHQERYQGFDPKSPTSVIGLSLAQEEYLDQSLLLASLIQEEFEKKLKRVNRGVKQAGFVVLYQTYMPSVLIETGFLTNKIEGKYLYSKEGQSQMSTSISKSIKDYYDRHLLNVAEDMTIEAQVDTETAKSGTYYKVQIASGKNKMNTASYNFKGLKNVERVKVADFYKYYLGNYYSKNKAYEALKNAQKKGYKTAFLVAFDTQEKEETAKVPKQEIAKETNLESEVYYKIQIASSSKKIETSPSNFKGLTEVEAVKVGAYYKYYFGKTSSYSKAKDYLDIAKSKSYSSSFITAFLNNERITLKEALKRQTN